MRRAARNKEVNRQDVLGSVKNFRMIPKGTAGNCASSHGNDDFRMRNSFVGFLKRQLPILRDGTGYQKAVGVSW